MSKKLIHTAAVAVAVASLGLTAALTTKGLAKNTPATSAQPLVALANTSQSATLVDRTVYVFTKPDGSTRKIVNSDWQRSASGSDFYQKTDTTEAAPINLKISYTLNGQVISAANLAGKSGKVTIRYDFENTAKSGDFYVPYTVLTGLVLDNDNFKNITTKNAKIFNDGSHTIITGVTLPGMQENLGLAKAAYEIPDYLEITADVNNFKLDMTMSLATSKLFAELDTSKLDRLDQISSQLASLQDAMNKLMDGSSELYNGLSELSNKSGALVDAIKKAAAGAREITGEDNLNSTKLAAGVKQVVDELAMPAALSTANTNFSPLFPIFAGINSHVGKEILPTNPLTSENYTDELTAWASAMDQDLVISTLATYGQDAAALKTNFLGAKDKLDNLNKLYLSTVAYTTGVNQLAAGLAELDGKTPALTSGITQLKDGAGKLKDGLSTFNAEGVEKLVNLYNGNVSGLSSRLKSIVNLSKSSQQNVKYIYRTDEIK